MMFDATKHSPAEPLLANALKQSLAATVEESQQVQELMQNVRDNHGALPQGTPLFMEGGPQDLFYIAPEIVQQNRELIEAVGTELVESLSKASTAEQQETELLAAMREVLDLALMHGANPQIVPTFVATIEGIFEEYEKAHEPVSASLEDMHERLTYYGAIVQDALTASEALMVRYQRHEGIAPEKMLRTPYALAYQRDVERHPEHASGEAPAYISSQAYEILSEIARDYDDALPDWPRSDMLALVLRCSERLHAIEVYKHDARQARLYNPANDNEREVEADSTSLRPPRNTLPLNEVALFDDPLVRRRAKHLLGQVFLKHAEAGESPKALMEAACSLDDALMLEERRAMQSQGR